MRSRAIAAEVLNRSLDFGVLTLQPATAACSPSRLAATSWSCWRTPAIRCWPTPRDNRRSRAADSHRAQRSLAGAGACAYERRHTPINIQVALPSLDGIKRAVEWHGSRGAAATLRLSEIANGQLVAIKVPGLSARRQVRLVFRRGEQSHAAEAFLEIVRATPAARARRPGRFGLEGRIGRRAATASTSKRSSSNPVASQLPSRNPSRAAEAG